MMLALVYENCERGSMLPRIKTYTTVVFAALMSAVALNAHAIVKDSSPARGSVVRTPDITIQLRFNSRIDASHSQLALVGKTGPHRLNLDASAPPDTLAAKASGLKPGVYRIEWQVLANDGHITRGVLPFTVE